MGVALIGMLCDTMSVFVGERPVVAEDVVEKLNAGECFWKVFAQSTIIYPTLSELTRGNCSYYGIDITPGAIYVLEQLELYLRLCQTPVIIRQKRKMCAPGSLLKHPQVFLRAFRIVPT